MSRASSLYRLQQIDTQLDRAGARLKEIEAALADSAGLSQARETLEGAEAALKEARAATGSSERAVTAQRDKIKQTETRLYSGSVQNPKELQDLQMESESLKRHLETLEDRLLEAMVNLDEVEARRTQAREAFEEVEKQYGDQHASLNAEQKQIFANVRRLEEERSAAVESIPKDDLAAYRKLREASGVAVALLENGSCSACGLTHSASFQQAVRSGTDLVRCSQCGRILYGG